MKNGNFNRTARRGLRSLPFLLVGLMLAWPARAADRITASLTIITNTATTNGMTLTVNGSVRTFTNNVVVSSSQVLTNATAVGSKTNLYNQIGLNPFSQVSLLDAGATNIQFVSASGVALTVTPSAAWWATVTYSTQTVSIPVPVRIPTSAEAAAVQTNVNSGLLTAIASTANTNVFYENTPAMANFVGKTNVQTITGAKTFSNPVGVWNGKVVSGTNISVTWLGTNRLFDTFQIMDEGDEPWNFKSGASSKDTHTILKVEDFNTDDFDIDPALTLGLGVVYLSRRDYTLTNTTLIKTTFQNTNTFPAQSDISFGRFAITSLANGNNAAVPVGTNVFVEVSGPSAAFTICGINGAPNRDGKLLILVNQTGFDMTIAHQSGTDPTAGNRIINMTGADRTTTANGAATLIYSGSASRWILVSFDP